MGGQRATPYCRLYFAEPEADLYRNLRHQYFAVRAVDELPEDTDGDCGGRLPTVDRGFAVGCGFWLFFRHAAPAVAAARSVRFSFDCHGVGVYEGASVGRFCGEHQKQEFILLHGRRIAGSAEAEYVDLFHRGLIETGFSGRTPELWGAGRLADRPRNLDLPSPFPR